MSIITMFVIVTLFCLTACTKNFGLECQFSQDSLTLSVGEEFNPNEFISSDKALTFSIDRENVLTKNEAGSFVATQSGRAIISAYNESVFVDSMEVYVKYKFLTPTNLKVSNDGVVTWDKSDVLVGEETISAVYNLKVKVNEIEEEFQSFSNYFILEDAGEYEISVKALSDEKVEESEYSSSIYFKFNLTQGVTDLSIISNKAFGSQTATIYWAGASKGVLNIDGVQTQVSGTSASFDFTYFQERQQIELGFVAVSDQGESITYNQTITKIKTPEVVVSAGEILWQDEQGAGEYILNLASKSGDTVSQIRTSETSSFLQGVEEGVYVLSYQAVAEKGFLNGDVKQNTELVAKIANVDAECSIEGNQAIITFSSSSEYNKRFIVHQNEKSFVLEFGEELQEGKYSLTKAFDLVEGENVFTVQALPTLSDGELFEKEGLSTSQIIKSDVKIIGTYYKLSEITNLKHYTISGESYLEFISLPFANKFDVKINDVSVDDVEIVSQEQTTILKIGKISKDSYGQTQQFKIELIASRSVEENQFVVPVSAQKTLTMLNAPSMQNLDGGELVSKNYQWQENVLATYQYSLFTTDGTFTTDGVEPEILSTDINQTRALNAGYYVLKVKAIPVDEDYYLASEEEGEDRFYFVEQLQPAALKLDYSQTVAELAEYSGYVLSIQTVEFGFKYIVKVDGNEVGELYNDNENEILEYNFSKDYTFGENGKQYKIEVEVFAENAELQTVHTNSISSLTVNRLATPTDMIVEENSTIAHVVNSDVTATLTIEKDGQILVTSQAGEDALVSVESYDGDFQIRARLNGYQNFEGFATDGQICLESAFATFAFHRSKAPSQLNYSQEEVSFVHDDKAMAYHVDIIVSSQNGNITRYFETQSKTFNLEEEIAELRNNDAVFNSYFTQKTKITIKVFADISLSDGGVYYLPSRYATLKYDSSNNELVISKLDIVSLNYDEGTEIISWKGVSEQNPQYLVYLGDELQQTITAPAQSGNFEFSVEKYDFLQPGDYKFYVIAKSDNSLQSDASFAIIFHKLSQIESLNVFKQDNVYYATFDVLVADVNYVTEILVNDESIGKNTQFILNADSFDIVLKGTSFKQDGNEIYFVSSTPSHFDIKQAEISSYSSNAIIQNNILTWNDFNAFVADWSLASPSNNLKYEVQILNQEGEVLRKISSLNENRLYLNNEELVNLVKGDYKVQIFAYFSEYTLSVQGAGYWADVLLAQNLDIKKLDSVQNLVASIDGSNTTIDLEFQKKVKVSWQFNGSYTSQINFEVYVNGSLFTKTTEIFCEIPQSTFNLSQNTIKVVATSATDVKSNEVTTTVVKFAQPQISIDDRGVLTIIADSTPAAQSGFIVEITIKTSEGDKTRTYYVSEKNVDIQPFINTDSGALSVRVIHKSTEQVAIPNENVATFNGRVLSQPQMIQDETGLSFTSTDADVIFFIKCKEKDFEAQVEGNHFNFPEEWQSGEYTITVYARKEGAVDSWTGQSAETIIEIDRIENINQISITRTTDYLDHQLTWQKVENSRGYQIQIYKNGGYVSTVSDVSTTSINLSELFKIDNQGGEYQLKFKTLADFSSTGLTNSHEFVFNLSVFANTVSDIKADSLGLLAFTAQSTGAGFYLSIKDAEGREHEGAPIILDADIREFLVKDLVGQLQINIRQLAKVQSEQIIDAENTTAVIDGAVQSASIYKLQDIISVSADSSTGKIILKLAKESGTRKFYVKTTDENGLTDVQLIDFTKSTDEDYDTLAIELCEKFAIKDNQVFSFTIYSVINNYFRSDEIAFEFTFRKSNSTIIQEKASETEDYILIKDNGTNQIENDVTKIHLRAKQTGAWKYYDVELDEVKGYWVTHTYYLNDQQIVEKSFSPTEIVGEGYVSELCYAINLTKLLDGLNSGAIQVQVGYITSKLNTPFIVNEFCASLNYTKLQGPSNLTISQGNLTWKNSAGNNTGFIINLEADNATNQIFISASDATYYLGENIKIAGEYSVALQAVSSELGVLPSNKLYYEKNGERVIVRKLDEIENELSISDGVMSLEFNDAREIPQQGQDETAEQFISKLDSIERRLAKSGVGTIWTSATFASRLLNDLLKYPFDYKLEQLKDLNFNLKFINTDTDQEYITSVSAIQLLTRLDEETLNSLNNVIKSISDNQTLIRLRAVYDILSSPYYFNGVATSSLLFDEIGSDETGLYGKYSANLIPAGNYNIYLQQQGSADNNTLSSAYSLKLQNVTVIDSPQTKTGEDSYTNQISDYYIKFRTVKNAEGVQYNNYTLVLKANSTVEGINNIEYYPVITYDITYNNGVWTRTAYNSDGTSTQILTTDSDGYVLIYINSKESGLIYEDAIVDIYGNTIQLEGKDFSVNIYVNGDDSSLNSKTENISVVFLKFDINSLKLNSGVFTWDNFAIGNKVYSTSVIYQHYSTAVQKMTISGQKPTLAFSNTGLYEYVTFYTQGTRNDYSIMVDSPTYTVNNVYKLAQPNVKVVDGKFLISDANSSFTATDFLVSNDVYQKTNINMFAVSTKGQDSITYQTGVNQIAETQTDRYNLGVSERTANIFYFATAGDSFELDETSITGSDKDGYVVNINQNGDDYENIYLQSATISTPATKLQMSSQNAVYVEDGDIHWNNAYSKSGLVLPDNLNIVYEVKVEYYHGTDAGWEIGQQDTTTFYTTNSYLSAQNIVDPSSDEYRYSISVKAHAYALATSGVADIITLENQSFVKVDNSQYTNGTTYVLEGELYFTGTSEDLLIQRSTQVQNFKITKGKISWEYQENAVFEVYNAEQNRKILLEGEITSQGSSYTFTLSSDVKQLEDNQSYNFAVIATQTGKIDSNISYMFDSLTARILSVLEQTDFNTDQISSTGDMTLNSVDFSTYFTRNSITNKSDIALQITVPANSSLIENEQTFIISNANKVLYIQIGGEIGERNNTIYLSKDAEGIEIFVQPIPFEPANTNYLLSAYKSTKLSFDSVEWSNQDLMYFDDVSQTFYWTYGVKFSNKTLGDTKIYKDTAGTPYGLDRGQKLTIEQMDLAGDSFVPIMYYSGEYKTYYIDVFNSYSQKDDNGQTRIYTLTELDMYTLEEDGTYQPSGLKTSTGVGYVYALNYFAVKAKMPFEQDIKTYYVPANLIQYQLDGDNALTFTVLESSVLYIDQELTTEVKMPNGQAITIVNYDQTKTYQNAVIGGENVYVLTENVYRFLEKDSNFEEEELNVHFKVTIVTEYQYQDGAYVHTVRVTREYDNVPLGNIQTSFGNYNVSENGIYVSSFEPNLIGTILEFKVQARKSQNNLLSKPLTISGAQNLSFNLFSLGDGSQDNPYQISNIDEFENIAYRYEKKQYHNTYKEKIYEERISQYSGSAEIVKNETSFTTVTDNETTYNFKQTENISAEVNEFIIDSVFVGSYDGGGKTFDISISGLEALETPISTRIASSAGSQTISFEKGVGVFKEIGEGGTVKNLDISFKLPFNSTLSDQLSSTNAIIGGLVLTNNGIVSNINVVSSNITFTNAMNSASGLAVAPVIGLNNKIAEQLTSQASIQISNTYNRSAQNFMYGGLVGFNNGTKSQIILCKNDGKININFASNQNGYVMVGGIAISNVNGIVEMTINNADLNCVSIKGSAYAGGIVAHSYGGAMYHSANAGNITAANAGGIAYSVTSMKATGIVGMGKVNSGYNYLFARSATYTADSGLNYTYSSYNPSGITFMKIVQNTDITCRNSDYTLQVLYDSVDSYSIQILKK